MSSEISKQSDEKLPSEIITTILSKQSVKSLLRFRTVCKTWRGIIDSPRFHQHHLLTSKTRADQSGNGKPSSSSSSSSSSFIFIKHFGVNDLGLLIEDEKVPCEFTISEIPLKTQVLSIKGIEPPVDGLVHYYSEKTHDFSDTSMYICNPRTEKHVKLPDFDFSGKQIQPYRGFGFDVTSNKYKVVQIFQMCASSEVHLYTLGTSSWRNVGEAPNVNFVRASSGAYLHGSLYWLANKDGVDGVSDLSKQIVSFDLSSEQFEVFPIGGNSLSINAQYLCEPEPGNNYFQITALDGCLVVVDTSFQDRVEISVSKNYNVKERWNTYFVSKFCGDRELFKRVMIISIQKHTELILLCDSTYLISFNTTTEKAVPLEKVKEEVISKGFPECFFYGPFSYVESLILPPPVDQRSDLEGMQESKRRRR